MGLKMRSHPGDWAGLCPVQARPQQLLCGLQPITVYLASRAGLLFLIRFGFSALNIRAGPTSRAPVNPQVSLLR